ncbi:MAG: RHS repeat protein, partial [Bacteroidales bacterium]|nr:RHS repeat protein [Bacteroidales bacterium]
DGKHYTFRLRYNRNGQLHRFIYPDGSRLTYDYDTAGRLLRTTYPDASHETYSYNDDGSLNGIKGRTGIWEWFVAPDTKATYDTLGRRTEEISYQTTDGNKTPVVTSYTYDDHNNWIRRTVAGISSPTRIDNRTFKYYTQ